MKNEHEEKFSIIQSENTKMKKEKGSIEHKCEELSN